MSVCKGPSVPRVAPAKAAIHKAVRTLEKMWVAVTLISALVLGTTLGSIFGSLVFVRVVTEMLVFMIFVLGLHLFVGTTGIMSFGHVGFMAVGAYSAVLLTMSPEAKAWQLTDVPGWLMNVEWPLIPAVLVGGLVAGAVGLAVSVPVLRLSGIPAAIITFAFFVIVQAIVRNWTGLTRGTSALAGVPQYTSIHVALVGAAAAIVITHFFHRSTVGLRTIATREDSWAAMSFGIAVTRERRIAFVLSAFLTGCGGALWAHFVTGFSGEAFSVNVTLIVLAMLIIGGMYSITGAVLGTVLVAMLREAFRRMEATDLTLLGIPGLGELFLALTIIIVLIVRSEGIVGRREVPWPFASSIRASMSHGVSYGPAVRARMAKRGGESL